MENLTARVETLENAVIALTKAVAELNDRESRDVVTLEKMIEGLNAGGSDD